MGKLNLLNVTLVLADNVTHELSRLALDDCLRVCDFSEVVVASNKNFYPNAQFIPVDFANLAEADSFRWTWHKYIKTSHLLIIEWDSWILNANLWNPLWLNFDYIGSIWNWWPENRVGNGGFSLRSASLLEYIDTHRDKFANLVHEDDVLCRNYRPALEKIGFKWAPDHVARRFAFERERLPSPTFGFHGLFNWPAIMSRYELKSRLWFCNDYIKSKPEWSEVAKYA